jgi:hypothetical protein
MGDRLGEPFTDLLDHKLQLTAFAFWQVVQAMLHPPSVAATVENAKDQFSHAT